MKEMDSLALALRCQWMWRWYQGIDDLHQYVMPLFFFNYGSGVLNSLSIDIDIINTDYALQINYIFTLHTGAGWNQML